MAILSVTPTLLFLLTLIISSYNNPIANAQEDNATSDLISNLQSLRVQSPTGVIHLTDPLLKRILSLPTPRPFSFLIFFDAQSLHSKPELSLPSLKSEFSLLSKSFLFNNPPETHLKLFFFDLEFQESLSNFALFAVNSLPNIKLIPSTAVDMEKDSVQMGPADFSKLADSMVRFVESSTNMTIGPINRPPMVSKTQIVFLIAMTLIWSPTVIKKASGNTPLHNKHWWMAGAIFVYFFSVSGAMYKIIRKVPMLIPDRNDPGKATFFVQGSGMQLGAEGFAIGFLYTIVGLLLAFATHALVSVKNKNVQRTMMIFVLFISFWAVGRVIYLHNWKAGFRIHEYWPSSWKQSY